jgi:hypothetical protein
VARKTRAQLGLTPLITFDHSDRRRRLGGHLPSVAQYSKAFLAFHKLYPWVTEFATWNEANYYGEPTAGDPKRVCRLLPGAASRLFGAARSSPPSCSISKIRDRRFRWCKWAREFVSYAHTQPKYWGLHNYVSANAPLGDGRPSSSWRP